MSNSELLGVGIYSPTEVARMVGVSPQKLHQWARGYTYRLRTGVRIPQVPIIQRELPEYEGRRFISFVELIELLIIRHFSDAGVHLAKIREAAKELVDMFGSSHPFALKTALENLYTDSRRIYVRSPSSDPDRYLLDITGPLQFQLIEIVEDYLKKIDFGELDLAVRWWPLGRDLPVVVDPRRSFGTPICSASGVPTYLIYEVHESGEQEQAIANWYEIDPQEVAAALQYENILRAA